MTPTDNPRQWVMHAQHRPDLGERLGREFLNIHPDVRTVRGYGATHPIVEVLLTEDPDGDYWGWIYADRPGVQFAPAFTGEPTMIQPHEGMFAMQFPYGPEDEQARGKGEIIRMRAALAAEPEDDAEPLCGESYDHDLNLIDEGDGVAVYECRECGAEVVDGEAA